MRYSVNELFVEGTCDVFSVTVCVVFECYGVVVLLCSSRCLCFVWDPMYCVRCSSFQISVLNPMGLSRVEISSSLTPV